MAKGNDMTSEKHAVILSGGGANGAYEIGVMKALFGGYVRLRDDPKERTTINPMVFTGTSVGSFSAAFMVSRPGQAAATTLAELEGLWRNQVAGTKARCNGVFRVRGNVLDLFNVNRMLTAPLLPPVHLLQDVGFFTKDFIDRLGMFFRSKDEVTHRLVDLVDFSSLICTDPLQELVRDTINLKDIRANEECVLVVAATNWEQGETELFTNLKTADPQRYKDLNDKIGHLAILASTAIPGIFPPVEIYHTKYADGGLLMNTPLSPAIRAGADVLHVIYLDPDLKDVPLDHGGGTLDVINRLSALSFASQVNRDVKQARNINQVLDLQREVGKTLETNLGHKRIKSLRLGPATEKIEAVINETLSDISRIRDAHKETFGKQDLRPITIHRYHPRSMLEGGFLGLLNFDSARVSELIDKGFQDAVTHDCIESGCIFPTLDDLCKVTERRYRRMDSTTG